MREIIHIQAGSFSNYTGTHYWNTQESYFVYDEDGTSITDHNISFKEGHDGHNQPTLWPRLLAFDQKSNFGTLTRDSYHERTQSWQTTWHGDVVRQEQERIPRSEYHARLDLEDDSEQAEPVATKIRYWSDFSRVYFDPRSIQVVPGVPEIVEGDWSASCNAFSRYDDDTELMDGSMRLLVEDCNNFQGIQMIQDTSNFGGFSGSLLAAFREEHPKATTTIFTCLSSKPLDVNFGDSSQIKNILNDALSLRNLAEFCDLTVPILPPSVWGKNCWFPEQDIDRTSLFQSSAILSSHIETATLPVRLRDGFDDLQTVVAHLNWRKSPPFAVLHGTLCPQGLSTRDLEDIASLSFHINGRALFAQRDVSRGLSRDEVAIYDVWSKSHELREPSLTWHHLPSYPIPTSFPPIFPGDQPEALKMVSSLKTSPHMGGHLASYAHFIENAVERHDNALLAMGLEDDEVKELVGALWDIVGDYGENEESDGGPGK